MSINHREILVIGAGPVGLFSVFACGSMNMSCHVVDSLPQLGGQCSALYPEKYLYDMPGFPKILAKDLVNGLCKQAERFDPMYFLNEKVLTFDFQDKHWIVGTESGKSLSGRSIIIAAGGGMFRPKRLPIPGIENYEGRSIFYHIHNPKDFEKRAVVIAGGGDSALDWALSLANIAHVTVVHRRDKFRAHPSTAQEFDQAVAEGKIIFKAGYQISDLDGDGKNLKNVTLSACHHSATESIACDILLPFFGLAHDLGPLKGWGLNVDHKGIIVDPVTCQTSQPQMYAVGDIARYPYKRSLIATGCAEAMQATQHIYQTHYPDKICDFGHSTSRFN